MSQFKADRQQTYNSAAAMANRWRGVVLTAEHTVNYAGAAVSIVGVITDTAPRAAFGVPVATRGSGQSIKVEAGAAFAAGAKLTTDSVGRFVTATSGQVFALEAREAATAAGDLIEATWIDGKVA